MITKSDSEFTTKVFLQTEHVWFQLLSSIQVMLNNVHSQTPLRNE